jgi:hypothetical protein
MGWTVLTVEEFVRGVGGGGRVAELMGVSKSAVFKWQRENRIVPRHWPHAKLLAEQHGLSFYPHNPGELARPKHWQGLGLGREMRHLRR